MFKNYFIIAWRNILKTKGYSSINIGGLAIGMAVAMLIGFWIYDELSYNKYHKNYDTIGQVMWYGKFNDQKFISNSIARPVETQLRNEYGDNFKTIVMARWDEDHVLTYQDTKISQNGRFMQAGAPEMLTLKMLKGNWSALKEMNSIIISESTAKALFGDIDPMEKMIWIGKKMNVKVTGIYEDLPYNTEFRNLKFISTWDLLLAQRENQWMKNAADNWGNQSFVMYVQINPNSNFNAVNSMIKNAVMEGWKDIDKRLRIEPLIIPMGRWHLYSEWKDGVNVGGRIQFVWLFAIIGVFVLLLACINFMNLSTARSEKRAKEVGIRKAVGSLRGQLIKQFLSESFLVVVLSFFIAIILVTASLPWFNDLADKKMGMMWGNPYFWIGSICFILVTSLVSGSYPAFYLSSFNPVKVLKGTFKAGRFAEVPRKVLVVLQFTVSIALIVGTLIVYRQIQHAKNRPVGYAREGLIMIPMKTSDFIDKYEVLSESLKNEGIASQVSKSSSPLTGIWSNNGGFEWKDKDPNKEDGFGTIFISHDYGKTVGWQLVAGRDFSIENASDSVWLSGDSTKTYSLVVNEAAVKYMGLKNPVGEVIKWDNQPFRIIGVIKDMLMESPYQPIRHNIYLVYDQQATSWINIKINPRLSSGEALKKTESVFKEVIPSAPFDYKFVDSEYALKFDAEERIGKLSSVFAALAVFISCLGLFGLASFMAEKRTKEIGIRKVLGASVYNLWEMLSKDFVLLVFVACFIAIPIAYFVLSQWLQKYEYRTDISWWIFLIAIGGALVITLLTVSFQAVKAAVSNPVNSLRSE